MLDRAKAKGWDVSAIQAALNAFQTAIQNAQGAHAGGADIIAGHSGFDLDGKVVDRVQALATIKALRQVLLDTRSAMNGTAKALRQAVQDFRKTHKPTPTTTPAAP